MRRALAIAVVLGLAAPAQADPLRLRGDALASAESPVGLIALSAEGDIHPTISAEAVVWAGGRDDGAAGDALVVVLRYRDPDHRGEARVGRFVAVTGALRPIHVDGGWGLVRLPHELRAEAFAGIPVERQLGAEAYDWVVGTRVARGLGEWGSVGLGYIQRREHGRLADEEVGADAAYAPLPWLDLAARAALDVIDTGLSEAHVSAAARRKAWRLELFGLHRSPSRILPATSLFSVLGDVPSQRFGASGRWRAAPRLDLDTGLALRRIGDDLGESLSARALLRLDDRGAGALSIEVRRESAPDSDWTGARAMARVPLPRQLSLGVEAELAVPDDARGRGAVWPWALAALSWRPAALWSVAAAFEASASPEHRHRFDALVRLSRSWEVAR